ncbi:erythromycin esterase family protein [Deinococcus yavapaiensis]|uniref:Erythromycin esterase-like protein n=1 Tax=Deinococcus yavapaiensis KR-236 TaxID=694435 RepID=A0A318S412_9DEIO|nr:erythromycin esterase family protein [Deinococcus yavapaiensis]PYE53149.1 erythromycin esterase-like protein [Deinococcus yavapaiensis KR-236]
MPNPLPLPSGWDLSQLHAALAAFLETLPARPRLLGLGEPTHAIDAFADQRNRLFEAFVEEHGFRSIALESDIVAGLRASAFISEGEGSLDDVMNSSFSHGFGARRANRDLVAWTRAYNSGREPNDRVRLYGFDPPLENVWAASPRFSLLALHAFLAAHVEVVPADRETLEQACGNDARWENPSVGMHPELSVGNSAEARQLRVLADDLFGLLRTEAPRLATLPGFWEAELHARTAAGLLRYHAIMADPSPARVGRMMASRALMMADNLVAIAEREHERGPTLVFAHNVHLQRQAGTMKIPSMGGMRVHWWSAGAHLDARLHARYAVIASDLGAAPDKEIGAPPPDTLQEGLMHLTSEAALVPSRDLIAALPPFLAARSDAPARSGYFPLGASHLPYVDGVLFLKNAVDRTG